MAEDVDNIEETEYEEEQSSKKPGVFAQFAKYFPMFMVSAALHFVILLIISLIPADTVQEEKTVTIITEIVEEEEPEEEIEEIEEIELTKTEVEVSTEVESSDSEPEEAVEVEEVEEAESDLDSELEEIVLLPDTVAFDSTNLAMIGLNLSGGSASNLPSGYGNRTGRSKMKAIGKGGGDKATEAAVDAALQWLALHQEPDGSWNAQKYEGKQHAKNLDPCTTACALLPFLGAGHSETSGKYKNTVKNGIRYLNAAFKDNFERPQFGSNYGASLILMAMAEASIFGSSPTTKKNANRMAEFLMDQYLKSPGEGWNYTSAGSDFSVSGWVSLGLKSAKAATLPIMNDAKAKTVMDEYKKWVKVMTNEKTGMGSYRPGRDGSSHMTWVGMFVRQAMGFNPKTDPFLKEASKHTVEWVNSGKWIGKEKPGAVYGIYYGTLAAFQQQGPAWAAWNPAMKKTLVGSQIRGNPKEKGGSWDPSHDHTGEIGGRVYTTALHALCLEVYYRYDMMN